MRKEEFGNGKRRSVSVGRVLSHSEHVLDVKHASRRQRPQRLSDDANVCIHQARHHEDSRSSPCSHQGTLMITSCNPTAVQTTKNRL